MFCLVIQICFTSFKISFATANVIQSSSLCCCDGGGAGRTLGWVVKRVRIQRVRRSKRILVVISWDIFYEQVLIIGYILLLVGGTYS